MVVAEAISFGFRAHQNWPNPFRRFLDCPEGVCIGRVHTGGPVAMLFSVFLGCFGSLPKSAGPNLDPKYRTPAGNSKKILIVGDLCVCVCVFFYGLWSYSVYAFALGEGRAVFC